MQLVVSLSIDSNRLGAVGWRRWASFSCKPLALFFKAIIHERRSKVETAVTRFKFAWRDEMYCIFLDGAPAFWRNVLPLTAGWTECWGSMYVSPKRWYLHTRLHEVIEKNGGLLLFSLRLTYYKANFNNAWKVRMR